MKRFAPLLIISLLMAAPAQAGSTKTVSVGDQSYSPAKLTISRGTTVKWVFKGNRSHNVYDDKHSELRSGFYGKGKSWPHAFRNKGTFNYYCSAHPYMRGTIIVR